MLKMIDDLDKKNKQFNNLALLPGFNIEDCNTSKRHNKYTNTIQTLDSITNKTVINDKLFTKFYTVIDSSEKKQTKKRQKQRNKKLTRRK